MLRRLRCADYTGNFSICKNKCFKHFVISRKQLCQSTLVSTRCAQHVALRRLHCCFSIWNNYFSTFRHISKTIGPIDLSVIALCSAGCGASTTLLFLQFARIRFSTFCHISKTIGSINLSVNALCSAGCALSTTLIIIQFARISVLNILSYLRNYWANRLSVNALCSAGSAAPNTLLFLQFAKIVF